MESDAPSVEQLARFVNGWSPSAREAAIDDPDEHPPLQPMLASLGVTGSAPRPAALAALAEEVYELFAAADSAERLQRLNGLVASARLHPQLTADGLRWTSPTRVPTLRGQAALALVHHWIDDPSLDRLSVCTGYHCADALVDHTQAQNRRYCSLTCQNRTKTRNRRQRLRAQR